LGGLEFELERAQDPRDRADPLQPELGDHSKYWVIRSTAAHGFPLVDLVFEPEFTTGTVKLLDYAVR